MQQGAIGVTAASAPTIMSILGASLPIGAVLALAAYALYKYKHSTNRLGKLKQQIEQKIKTEKDPKKLSKLKLRLTKITLKYNEAVAKIKSRDRSFIAKVQKRKEILSQLKAKSNKSPKDVKRIQQMEKDLQASDKIISKMKGDFK
jgi:hypothetical protein